MRRAITCGILPLILAASSMLPATPAEAAPKTHIGVEDDDCSDITCNGLSYTLSPWPGVFSVDFGVQPQLTSNILIDFKARIVRGGEIPYPGGNWVDWDAVTFAAVNDLGPAAQANPSGSPWAWRDRATIEGSAYVWYEIWLPADLNEDGVVDWTSGPNTLYLMTWSGYSPVPSVSGWDAMVVSLDYNGDFVRDHDADLEIDVFAGPERARTLAYGNAGTLTSNGFDLAPATGTLGSITGSGTIPSTVSGDATIGFDVAYDALLRRWTGTVALSDPAAGFAATVAVHSWRFGVTRNGMTTSGTLWGIKARSSPRRCFLIVFEIVDRG
jgi:hypothetical protein